MKMSMSRDGENRIDLRVQHRVSGTDIARALTIWKYEEPEGLPRREPPLRAVMEILRNELAQFGEDRIDWYRERLDPENMDPRAVQSAWVWARDLTRKLLPDLTVWDD